MVTFAFTAEVTGEIQLEMMNLHCWACCAFLIVACDTALLCLRLKLKRGQWKNLTGNGEFALLCLVRVFACFLFHHCVVICLFLVSPLRC